MQRTSDKLVSAPQKPEQWCGRAAQLHPAGTENHPDHWWTALQDAITQAGALDDVAAISVAGQQHGMVCLDNDGEVIRPALLWNDTRSVNSAADLIKEEGNGDTAAGADTGRRLPAPSR